MSAETEPVKTDQVKTEVVPADTAATVPDYLKSARDISFVATIFLYYMGWVYIYNYLGAFGLPVRAVNPDFNSILIYSSNIFIYSYNEGKIYLLLLLLITFLLITRKRERVAAARFIPLFVLLLFPFVFFIARKAALSDAKNAVMAPAQYLKSIEFVFNDAIDPENTATPTALQDSIRSALNYNRHHILKQNRYGMFRLIAMSGDEFFVLQTGDEVTEECYRSYIPMTFVIKKNQVEFVKITK